MAHFFAYNTGDPAAEQMEYKAVAAKGEVAGLLQTDQAQNITGSAYSEQTGAVFIQQAFDGGTAWDISEEIKLTAKKATSFSVPSIAPIAQIKFVNGNTESKEVRIYARAQSSGT